MVVITITFSSCQQVDYTAPQELKSYSWYSTNENGTEITLSFSEDTANFSIKGDEEITCNISGRCVTDESTIIIFDLSMAENLVLEYKIFGDHITLTYGGYTISLVKL